MFEELKRKAKRDTILALDMERPIALEVLLVIAECEHLQSRLRKLESPTTDTQ